MAMTITVQATRWGEVVDERVCSTTAGARKAMLAMLRRVGSNADQVQRRAVEIAMERWTGGDLAAHLPTWNRTSTVSIHVEDSR